LNSLTNEHVERFSAARSRGGNIGRESDLPERRSTHAAGDDRETFVSAYQAMSTLSEKLKIFATIRNKGDVDPTNDLAFAIASNDATSVNC
jgi:hypothetical protein